MYQISINGNDHFAKHWRNLAEYWRLSPGGRERLEWMIFYYTVGNRSARGTASYFGIAPKTFHKWKGRFNPKRIQSLEELSRAPKKKRTWQVSPTEESRVRTLREKHIKYGKRKLKVLYQEEYSEEISTWKIERVVRKPQLYPDYQEQQRRRRQARRRSNKPKTRIQTLKEGYQGTLWHTDTVILWWYGVRRVIFTAMEDKTKLAFAHVYKNNTSRKAKDFLKRLVYLSNGELSIIHSDNGAEFAGEFEAACIELKIQQVYSRVRQPKDNPALERFNRTLQEEWLDLSEVGLDDPDEANLDLTNWLIEYNFHRPHQALDYQTPIAYAYQTKVLPKTPASTGICCCML